MGHVRFVGRMPEDMNELVGVLPAASVLESSPDDDARYRVFGRCGADDNDVLLRRGRIYPLNVDGVHSIVFLASHNGRQIVLKSQIPTDIRLPGRVTKKTRQLYAELVRRESNGWLLPVLIGAHPLVMPVFHRFVGSSSLALPFVSGDEYLSRRVVGRTTWTVHPRFATSLQFFVGNVVDCLSGREAGLVLFDLCESTSFILSRGVVHRGVTPENVYLSYDGRAVLGDFGSSLALFRYPFPEEAHDDRSVSETVVNPLDDAMDGTGAGVGVKKGVVGWRSFSVGELKNGIARSPELDVWSGDVRARGVIGVIGENAVDKKRRWLDADKKMLKNGKLRQAYLVSDVWSCARTVWELLSSERQRSDPTCFPSVIGSGVGWPRFSNYGVVPAPDGAVASPVDEPAEFDVPDVLVVLLDRLLVARPMDRLRSEDAQELLLMCLYGDIDTCVDGDAELWRLNQLRLCLSVESRRSEYDEDGVGDGVGGLCFGLLGCQPDGVIPMADRVLGDDVDVWHHDQPVWMWHAVDGHASGHDHHLRLRMLVEWDGVRLRDVALRLRGVLSDLKY